MSGIELPAALGSMLAGSGAATAGAAGASAIPELLAGAAMSSGAASMPGIFAAAPAATSAIAPAVMNGATSFAPMAAGAGAGTSAMDTALTLAQQNAMGPIGPLMPNGQFNSAMPSPPTPGQIPLVQPQPAWRQALASTATVQDMMLKQRAANRLPPSPPPTLRAGQSYTPKLGTLPAAGPSPMQRFAALLRAS